MRAISSPFGGQPRRCEILENRERESIHPWHRRTLNAKSCLGVERPRVMGVRDEFLSSCAQQGQSLPSEEAHGFDSR